MTPGIRAVALSAAGVAGCIPDLGPILDAPVDPTVLPDRPVDGPAAFDAVVDGPADVPLPDVPLVTCGTPTLIITVETVATDYLPDRVEAPVGACIKFCVANLGGHAHTNTSDDGLFEPFDTGAAEADCRVFFEILAARAGPYRLYCTQHAPSMQIFLTAR